MMEPAMLTEKTVEDVEMQFTYIHKLQACSFHCSVQISDVFCCYWCTAQVRVINVQPNACIMVLDICIV